LITDADGTVVATVESVSFRPLNAGDVRQAGHDPGYGLEWTPVAVPTTKRELATFGEEGNDFLDLEALGQVPDAVLVTCSPDGADPVAAAAGHAARVLRLPQSWLSDDRFADSRLVVVTTGAVATRSGSEITEIRNLGQAAVWGLLRAAQTEHPDRFVLIDTDRP